MNFRTRSYQKELLDGDDIPFADIRRNMKELNTINALLGGHAITLKGFKTLLGDKDSISVCEIGCGGGDNLAAIVQWCRDHDVSITCTGIDMKKECIVVAQELALLSGITNWITSDYRSAVLETKPDIIFSSLFCHHFTDAELVEQLRWMQQNSHVGFFINDLQRNWLAYHSIRLLTAVFSRSYLVKYDAPVSVTRGFLKKEWERLCNEAGITNALVKWRWAFRYLIIFRHADK